MSTFTRIAAHAIVLTLAFQTLSAQQSVRASAETLYHKAADWPQLPPGMKLGFIVNVIPQPDDSVWIFQRSNPPILHLDSRGRLLTSFGDGIFGHVHGMCMTRDGHIWAGDSGDSLPTSKPSTTGYVFYEFNQKGEVLITLGKRGVSAVGPDTFIAPTACIEAPNGDIIISDGHVPRAHNQDHGDRLIRFSAAGQFITAYGETGKSQGQFRGIHQLAYDSQGRLFVADSKNSRIQILDRSMKPVAVWTAFGRPSMIFITSADTLLSVDTESGLKLSWLDYPGDDPAGIKNPTFSVGVRVGSARSGVVDLHFDPDPEVASDMLAADLSGNLYVRGAKWIKNTATP